MIIWKKRGEMKMEKNKPKCKLIGTDGNIFALMGTVSKCLKQNGMGDKVAEMIKRVTSSESYDAALIVLMDYVDVR